MPCSFISEMLLLVILVLTFCTSVTGVICERIFLVLCPHRLFLTSTGFVQHTFLLVIINYSHKDINIFSFFEKIAIYFYMI